MFILALYYRHLIPGSTLIIYSYWLCYIVVMFTNNVMMYFHSYLSAERIQFEKTKMKDAYRDNDEIKQKEVNIAEDKMI